jgi:hypothetical protein
MSVQSGGGTSVRDIINGVFDLLELVIVRLAVLGLAIHDVYKLLSGHHS